MLFLDFCYLGLIAYVVCAFALAYVYCIFSVVVPPDFDFAFSVYWPRDWLGSASSK